jgi:hypothetical protein
MQWEPPGIEEAARLFPNYEILGLLGRGGMGAVYKARQLALDRFVAIKLLPLEVSTERDFADRFVREARTMAKLNHPNIIAVHDFGTTSEGHLFFVMEFVGGANLHSIIHEVGLDPDQALYLAGEVCAALAYAHGKGVVHRDIKPANVMVDRESKVKVADFGLARLTEANPEMHGMTLTGMVMGTPDYMAPEQKRGLNVDHRADIYSLGVMLYEMVCREVPQGVFDPPSRRIGCDQRLDAIVLKAMNQSPERRYQSTKEMEAELEAARKPVPSAPIPQPRALVPRARAMVPVPKPVAPVPVPRRAVAPITVVPVGEKSRTPLYAGIAVVVLGGIIAIGMAVQKPKLKQVAERTVPDGVKPAPAPVVETPKEKPATPGAKPAPERPKEQPVAATPEMKPKPEPSPAPADAPQQSATAKWLAGQEPQWQAAYATEVTAAFDKAVADQRKQFISSLDTQLANATRGGLLLEAVACRDELQRMNAGGAPGADDGTTPASLKAMRAGYRKNLAALEADRAARAKAVHARYDSVLGQNLTLLTQNQRFDEAMLLKAKREELAAAWLRPAPNAAKVASANPQTGAKPPVSSSLVPIGTRLAENVTLYAAGSGQLVFFNGEELMRVTKDKASSVSRPLYEGDIIAVRRVDDGNCFWLSCIASTGQFLFETSENWFSYKPKDPEKWWEINLGARKAAQYASDTQRYVNVVKQSAAQTPLYRGTQPICTVIAGQTPLSYLYFVVRKEDLVLKNERKAEVAPASVPVPVKAASAIPEKAPFGMRPGPVMAKVEAQDTVLTPLTKGEAVWGNKPNLIFTEIPESFQGFQFTQAKTGGDTLRFKVLSDGLVYLACTSLFRNSGNNGNGWHERSLKEAHLQEKGWHKERDIELKDSEGNHVFWVYSRTCKSGQEFSICTDKYRSPILLVKE